ncbi:MAG: hypothetical protein KIS85_02575 [Anaerolineales bacterium]|nr:hypothetical protein [Anaerolineales bacterium]
MKTAGYSGKPLAQKLGIKPGQRACVLHAPAGYLQLLNAPDGVEWLAQLGEPHDLDFIHYFTLEAAQLAAGFAALKTALAYDGTLWISWPKQASKVPTDLNENAVRELGLQTGLVDVKVAAVDDTWSGLKFVYRLEDRQPLVGA